MKKREVYEGWRFECEGDMFRWCERLTSPSVLDFSYKQNGMKSNPARIAERRNCPCGKGCKPIRCRIIVENEIKEEAR